MRRDLGLGTLRRIRCIVEYETVRKHTELLILRMYYKDVTTHLFCPPQFTTCLSASFTPRAHLGMHFLSTLGPISSWTTISLGFS